MLVAVALLGVLIDVIVVAPIARNVWADDIDRNVAAARALLDGTFGTDTGYLYSPLAALITTPLTLAPAGLAALLWLAIKLGVLGWGVRHETAGLDGLSAVLVGVAVFAFVPTTFDLLVGNITVLLLAAVALVFWRRDQWQSGVALGLLLATAPKPQLVPILIWMLVFRRRSLVGAFLVAAGATLVGLAVTGPENYLRWIGLLREPDYFRSPMLGNLTPEALVPAIALPLELAGLIGFVLALRRGAEPGFVAALAVGLLIAPYTLVYAPMTILLGVRTIAQAAPRVAIALVGIASTAVVVALPLYATGWLAAAFLVRPRSLRPAP